PAARGRAPGGGGGVGGAGGGAAGARARGRGPRQRAGEIGCRRQALAHVGARRRVGYEKFNRVVSPLDRGGIGERRRQALGKQARARRRHAAGDGGKERSAPLAPERAPQLEGAAGRLVARG